jgi:hypothetical protein
VEGKLAVITAEDVQLPLYYVGSVTAARPWLVVTGLYLFPVVLFDVENMNIIHPMHAIIPSKVVDLGIDEAASSAHSNTWLSSCHFGLNPG